ncbi:ATP-dependent nuclease [Spirillospora sp. CA-253888]
MADLHRALSGMMKAGKFEPYIHYIRFPFFRNIREMTRIDFEHPVTALVGSNGTNKTAVLRALQGCPDQYNLGQYWFSTNLDPIQTGDRHRFIYGYKAQSVGEMVEVIKSRIDRQGDPDYWEPARPIISDGMSRMPAVAKDTELPPERSKTRWKAVRKNVVYLDFRSELSAYDKYFFHVPFDARTPSLPDKKAFIRRRAKYLAEALNTARESHVLHKIERIVEPARELSVQQCEEISNILGREYVSIKLIKHKYFGVEGSTVVMKTVGLQYSEAFAGSGEFAVAMLVAKVTEAPSHSLILLDEPEVSLHPGAQRKLIDFLCKQAREKYQQIIVSTHSPEIVRNLPAKAIKVFHANGADGRIELVSQESEASEAFFRLGFKGERKKTVYVEDRLAEALVRKAIRPLGESFCSLVEVQPIPGGTNSIQLHFIPSFALSRTKDCLILLDGDQVTESSNVTPEAVAETDLEGVVRVLLHGEPRLSLNGSGGTATPGERVAQLRAILQWCKRNLDFLPGDDPESLLLSMTNEPVASSGSKARWVERTRAALGREAWEPVTAQEILGEQERLLAQVDDQAPELVSIRERVQLFVHSA